mmetsp:Transcript_60278/g.72465  ORF Transcript_60278/g.72465 Transcript_60278/m.72465 type:complete len:106 (+) Transcript_60278:697-1014(+)
MTSNLKSARNRKRKGCVKAITHSKRPSFCIETDPFGGLKGVIDDRTVMLDLQRSSSTVEGIHRDSDDGEYDDDGLCHRSKRCVIGHVPETPKVGDGSRPSRQEKW